VVTPQPDSITVIYQKYCLLAKMIITKRSDHSYDLVVIMEFKGISREYVSLMKRTVGLSGCADEKSKLK